MKDADENSQIQQMRALPICYPKHKYKNQNLASSPFSRVELLKCGKEKTERNSIFGNGKFDKKPRDVLFKFHLKFWNTTSIGSHVHLLRTAYKLSATKIKHSH